MTTTSVEKNTSGTLQNETLFLTVEKARQASKRKEKSSPDAQNALIYAYLQILSSVQVSLASTQTSAKELNACEHNMSINNNRANSINFVVIQGNGMINKTVQWNTAGKTVWHTTYGPDHNAINYTTHTASHHYQAVQAVQAQPQDYNQVEEQDQQIQKERDFFSNKIMIFQQSAQVQQTNIGSKNDYMSQFIQEDTNISTILSTLSSQIAQMLRTP